MSSASGSATPEFRVPLPYSGPVSHSSRNNNSTGNVDKQQQHSDSSSSSPSMGMPSQSCGLEFDGTTVLCRVCGDKASGFHYGVHSCEGCKGFFRRSIQQKIQYRPCTKNQQCSILRVNRNRCQYCRLKKCIAVGMSRDAVRFGRVPKREKAKILAAMQQSNIAKSAEHALARELEDIDKLTTSIVEAHLETCEFTRAKVERMFEGARRDTSGKMACPLNPQSTPMTDFSSRFSPAIRGVVEFAKRLPGFNLLSQDDQVTLLKAGVFEVLLVRLASMFRNNAMLCINGVLLERCNAQGQNTRFLLDSMFKFAEGFNELGLNDEVVGIFCAVVIMASDRPGLRNTELIHRLSMNFRQALNAHLPPNLGAELERKIPDLRTLNTLHSEKLLAFKMEESFQDQPTQTTPEYTYKSFPSPSADSGIESGNCSSPARSEDFGSVCEEMPVLKRALQAPPMVDNTFVCEFSKVNHKKFRRQSPPPPPTQTPPPAMLYPQLASALTRPPPPLPSHHHQHSHPSTSPSSIPSPASSHSSQSSLFSSHSTLALRLNEKPSNCETSDYIHSLIMAEPSPDYESPLNLSTKHPGHSSTTTKTIQV